MERERERQGKTIAVWLQIIKQQSVTGIRISRGLQSVLWKVRQPFGPRVPQRWPWWSWVEVNFFQLFQSDPTSLSIFQVLNIQPFFEVCPQGTEVEAVEAENLHFCIIFHRRWSSCLKLRGLLLMFVEKRTDFLCDWLRCQSIFSNKQFYLSQSCVISRAKLFQLGHEPGPR